ncbi:hypothetical protein BDV34DRAFT_185820 [Aspergillus parasiticus]|uniref:Uncharacterized protein n=1 Tax=Aspergillus parasiticus TaxID=5067 RepID=A0A5N6E130_ASPPA|nr:hypothetical protein BDV34DRAFT_185820 [Aspergillus parasiticus]
MWDKKAPNSVAKILDTCIVIDLKVEQTAVNGGPSELLSDIDPIRLSIFGHRFICICDAYLQMF